MRNVCEVMLMQSIFVCRNLAKFSIRFGVLISALIWQGSGPQFPLPFLPLPALLFPLFVLPFYLWQSHKLSKHISKLSNGISHALLLVLPPPTPPFWLVRAADKQSADRRSSPTEGSACTLYETWHSQRLSEWVKAAITLQIENNNNRAESNKRCKQHVTARLQGVLMGGRG